MEDWKEYKLGELLTIKYGKDHKKLKDGDIPAYGSGGVMRWVNQAIYNGPSIMIPRKGSLNNILYSEKPFWTVDTMFWSIINDNIVNPIFLYYSIYKKDFASLNVGSAVPSLTIPILNDIKIKVPSSDIQNKIISILKPLDDKIELNRRINGNLEQQAQALFKAWFVDFEPFKNGKFVDSELGRIPEGWKVGHFTDIVKVSGGGTPRTNNTSFWNGSIPFFTPKDASDIVFTYKTEKHITNLGVSNCNSPIYPAHTVFITARGTIGKIKMAGKPMVMNQSCYALLTKKEKLEPYIYLLSLRLVNIMQKKANGAVFEAITTKDFEENIVIPPNEILTSFIQLVNPLFFQIHHNGLENQNLIILKEALLPRLMSGELNVNIITE